MDTTPRVHGGFHSVVEEDHPYIFIDSCMQIWPDADFAVAHKHGVTAYGVTAFEPNDPLERVLEQLMFWHLVARRHPNLFVATTADDIRRADRLCVINETAAKLWPAGEDPVGRQINLQLLAGSPGNVLFPTNASPTVTGIAFSWMSWSNAAVAAVAGEVCGSLGESEGTVPFAPGHAKGTVP